MTDHRNPSLRNLVDYEDASLVDRDIQGRTYRSSPESRPERVAVLAFGNATYEGSVNQQLAEAVHAAIVYFGKVPVFAQSEVCNILDQYGIEHKLLREVGPMWGEYGDTEEMLGRLNVLADGASGDTMMVAHPAQMERVMYLADHAGLERTPFVNRMIGWNRREEEQQLWVTSPALWVPREIGIRLYDLARL